MNRHISPQFEAARRLAQTIPCCATAEEKRRRVIRLLSMIRFAQGRA